MLYENNKNFPPNIVSLMKSTGFLEPLSIQLKINSVRNSLILGEE
jgi:hypothetical protein